MRLFNFKSLIVVLGWPFFYGCSDQEQFVRNAKQFEGRTFISETYGRNLKATLLFMEDSNLVVKNIPFGIHFSKPYQILMSNESPSGRPTINVERNY